MKAEIERFNFAKLVPSATFGKFIVEIPARSERVTNYIMMNGLSDESSELLDKDPRALLELFELSETGFFTLKHDENPEISLTAYVCRDDRPVFSPIKLTSFVEVVPITPANVHATLPV